MSQRPRTIGLNFERQLDKERHLHQERERLQRIRSRITAALASLLLIPAGYLGWQAWQAQDDVRTSKTVRQASKIIITLDRLYKDSPNFIGVSLDLLSASLPASDTTSPFGTSFSVTAEMMEGRRFQLTLPGVPPKTCRSLAVETVLPGQSSLEIQGTDISYRQTDTDGPYRIEQAAGSCGAGLSTLRWVVSP